MHKSFIALCMRSAAKYCIIPMQDYLGLDNSARLNHPSTTGKNWRWRATKAQLSDELQKEIADNARRYGRFQAPSLQEETEA